MSFETKIISNSKIKQNKLLRPAKVASKKPDTGVEIKNKSAYYVIRDCADITQKYLVHLCYSSYNDPILDLSGKFTEKEIIDFVARSQQDGNDHLRQLIYIIFTDIARKQGLYEKVITNEPAPIDWNEQDDDGDIYGEYDYVEEEPKQQPEEIPLTQVDITDGKSVIARLIEAFGATREK